MGMGVCRTPESFRIGVSVPILHNTGGCRCRRACERPIFTQREHLECTEDVVLVKLADQNCLSLTRLTKWRQCPL